MRTFPLFAAVVAAVVSSSGTELVADEPAPCSANKNCVVLEDSAGTKFGVVGTPSSLVPTINAYLGVPFARSQVFQQAAAVTTTSFPSYFRNVANSTVDFDASGFGPMCPQDSPSLPSGVTPTLSFDCLHLNVWAPANAKPGDNLPVMFFVYGGAFAFGSNMDNLPSGKVGETMYDGSELSNFSAFDVGDKNMIVVVANYRTGLAGFSPVHYDPAAQAYSAYPMNHGLRDQIAALDWVYDNIDSFGGDSANITLFGESAGAMSIGIHLTASPAFGSSEAYTGGAVKRAIMQSNPLGYAYADASTVVDERTKATEADLRMERFARCYSFATNAVETSGICDVVSKTVAMPAYADLDDEANMLRFLNAQARYGRTYGIVNAFLGGEAQALSFAPMIDDDSPLPDGVEQTMTQQPAPAFQTSKPMHDMPILMGFNKTEGILFTQDIVAAFYETSSGQGGTSTTSLDETFYQDLVTLIFPDQVKNIILLNSNTTDGTCPEGQVCPYNNCGNQGAGTYGFTNVGGTGGGACATGATSLNASGLPTCGQVPKNCVAYDGTQIAMSTLISDFAFTCANALIGDNVTFTGTNRWMYRLDVPSVADLTNTAGGDVPSLCGPDSPTNTCHGTDLPYVFGSMALAGGSASTAEANVADLLISSWGHFAQSDDPSGDVTWTTFSGENPLINVIGQDPSTGDVSITTEATSIVTSGANCSTWQGLMPQ